MRQDLFAGDYNIDTPESVAFDFEIADLGNRFLAALIDTLILFAGLVGLSTVMFLVLRLADPDAAAALLFGEERGGWWSGLILALYAVLDFFIFWGYYMLLELRWNGQTIGKRVMRIRVVRADGAPAGAAEIAVRNLVRIVDLLPTGYLVGFLAVVASKQARRLGDWAAGTLVVKAGGSITLDSLLHTYAARSEPAAAGDLDVRTLRPADIALIQDALARSAASDRDRHARDNGGLLIRLADAIARRIGYQPQPGENARLFLERVVASYQRPR